MRKSQLAVSSEQVAV